jgi:hypothetical protein
MKFYKKVRLLMDFARAIRDIGRKTPKDNYEIQIQNFTRRTTLARVEGLSKTFSDREWIDTMALIYFYRQPEHDWKNAVEMSTGLVREWSKERLQEYLNFVIEVFGKIHDDDRFVHFIESRFRRGQKDNTLPPLPDEIAWSPEYFIDYLTYAEQLVRSQQSDEGATPQDFTSVAAGEAKAKVDTTIDHDAVIKKNTFQTLNVN